MPTRPPAPPDGIHRILAAACAALVLALTIFAASPAAHDWLHLDRDGATAHADDDCAVVLFASGVSLPLQVVDVPLPGERACDIAPAAAVEVFLVSPRYLRQPERGPPSERTR